MEPSQFTSAPTPTSNGTNREISRTSTTDPSFAISALLPTATSTAAAVRSNPSTPPVSPKLAQNLAPGHVTKLPNIVSRLTGAAALANRKKGQNPGSRKAMNEESRESEKVLETSPNPAAVFSGYPTSRSGDAPEQETSPTSQKVLGSIATAANAMDTSGSSTGTAITSASPAGSSVESSTPTATAGPTNTDHSLLHPHGDSNSQYQSIAQQPLRAGSISEQLSATTPTTPGFNATTPTTPFSPSATTPGGSRGKHVCPHCHQTFTRHHNLKSHLLTHSHEKPFLCQTCNARFRRLHDLKRHSKLHTGERPHVCHKCGRKFARGDALARHARAEGGCAGRRSSMVEIAEDDSMVSGMTGDDDGGMEGLEGLIDGDPDGDVDMIDDAGGSRRRSLPSIRTDFSSGPQNTNIQSNIQRSNPITPASGNYGHTPNTHHNTYPSLGTPNRTASTAGPSPASGAGLFSSHLSVKSNIPPLSPMQTSATTVPGPTPTSAGGSGNTSSILSPHVVLTDSSRGVTPANQEAGSERNPSFTFMGNLHPGTQQQPPSQRDTSMGGAPTASMAGINLNSNMFSTGFDGLWGYIKSLEDRVKSLEETVVELRTELKRKQQPPLDRGDTAIVTMQHEPQQHQQKHQKQQKQQKQRERQQKES